MRKTASLLCFLPFVAHTQAAVVVVTTKSADTSVPVVSSTDLAQAAGTTYSGTSGAGGDEIVAQVGQIFNGVVGNVDGDTADSGEVTVSPNSSFTVTFNLTGAAFGYDITNIYSVFGWNTGGNGRSNQGYAISFTRVDNSTFTLMSDTVWEANNPADYFTTVNFSNSGGGALNNDTYSINGGSSVTGTGNIATGIKAMTISGIDAARVGGVVVIREIDVTGIPTVPEPSAALLGGLGLLGLLRRRRA